MQKNITKPLVSFVIRTKNEGRFLGKVLQYLYSQSYKNIEIIIVDSGSTDKTLKIIDKYPHKFIQIKPEEFNYSKTLNLGISKARGEIIGIISGHSIPISDTWLESGTVYFKDLRVAAVTGAYIELPFGYYSKTLGQLSYKLFVDKKRSSHWPWMTNTNALIRKSFWKDYPFDESLKHGCEDYDWALEMLARGYKVIREPKFSVHHSHILLGRKPYLIRKLGWMKITPEIKNKKRPSQSKLKINV